MFRVETKSEHGSPIITEHRLGCGDVDHVCYFYGVEKKKVIKSCILYHSFGKHALHPSTQPTRIRWLKKMKKHELQRVQLVQQH